MYVILKFLSHFNHYSYFVPFPSVSFILTRSTDEIVRPYVKFDRWYPLMLYICLLPKLYAVCSKVPRELEFPVTFECPEVIHWTFIDLPNTRYHQKVIRMSKRPYIYIYRTMLSKSCSNVISTTNWCSWQARQQIQVKKLRKNKKTGVFL